MANSYDLKEVLRGVRNTGAIVIDESRHSGRYIFINPHTGYPLVRLDAEIATINYEFMHVGNLELTFEVRDVLRRHRVPLEETGQDEMKQTLRGLAAKLDEGHPDIPNFQE